MHWALAAILQAETRTAPVTETSLPLIPCHVPVPTTGASSCISSVLKGRRNAPSPVLGSFHFLLFSGESPRMQELAQGQTSGRRSWGSVAPPLLLARPGVASPLHRCSGSPLRAGAQAPAASSTHPLLPQPRSEPAPGVYPPLPAPGAFRDRPGRVSSEHKHKVTALLLG